MQTMLENLKLNIDWKGKRFHAAVELVDADPDGDGYIVGKDSGNLEGQRCRERMLHGFVRMLCEHHAFDDAAGDAVRKSLESQLQEAINHRSFQLETNQKSSASSQPTADMSLGDTDLMNAKRLVLYAGNRIRWCDAWRCWLVWDGKRWKADDRQQVYGIAKAAVMTIYSELAALPVEKQAKLAKHARDSQSRFRVDAMIAMARPEVAVTPAELDVHDWLIATENGVIDLRTGAWANHDPSLYLTKVAPVVFNPQATCPRWEKFIGQIMCGDPSLIDYLHRLLGMCLTGDVTYQALPIFWGAGCNGKSTLLDVLKGVLGEYVGTAPDSLVTTRSSDEHPTEISTLQGRRLVVAAETEEGRKLRTSLVKRMTGESHLTARKMRGDYYEFKRTNKTILVTNNKPRLTELSDAIRRRVKLVPFLFNADASGERDDNLLTKLLSEEKSGIFNWLVSGCLKWQRSGIAEPPVVREATADYFEQEDPLREFLDACCVLGDSAWAKPMDLFTSYTAWAASTGNKYPLSQRTFLDRIRQRFGEVRQVRIDGMGPYRVISGVGLRRAS